IFLVISVVRFVIGRRGVKARQPQRTAREIDKCDNPAGARKCLENDAVNHQSWCDAEGDDIGERIKLATKHAVMSTDACDRSAEQIRKTGRDKGPGGAMKH